MCVCTLPLFDTISLRRVRTYLNDTTSFPQYCNTHKDNVSFACSLLLNTNRHMNVQTKREVEKVIKS